MATATGYVDGTTVWETWSTTSATVTSTAVFSTTVSDYTGSVYTIIDERRPAPSYEWNGRSYAPIQPAGEANSPNDKAKKLLALLIGEKEVEEFEKRGWFEIEGQDGNTYRINVGEAYNVFRMNKETNRVAERICFVPKERVPPYDRYVSQALMLSGNIEGVNAVANR